MQAELERAVALLGPLEGRVMRAVWTRAVPDSFVVRDVHAEMTELAYTTVMTTVARLAAKGLLTATTGIGRRAYHYQSVGGPSDHLRRASEEEAQRAIERYGDAALAAFAAQLDRLPTDRRERLRHLAGQ